MIKDLVVNLSVGAGRDAAAPYAISVGALDTRGTVSRSDDRVADWSSRGPCYLDDVMKPDLVAPGTGIESLYAPGSYLAGAWNTADSGWLTKPG